MKWKKGIFRFFALSGWVLWMIYLCLVSVHAYVPPNPLRWWDFVDIALYAAAAYFSLSF